MTSDQLALWQRLETHPLDDPAAALPFSLRLAQENTWPLGFTRRAVAEYRRFAFLAVAAGHPVSPPDAVDQVWHLHLLYTQDAMIAGQAIIAFPVLAAVALAAIQGADQRVRETALALGATRSHAAWTTLFEVRFALVAAVLNGFGRVISEVGCAMMVGGNIAGLTRNIPTAISLETSKGDFAQGIALGVVLMFFALGANLLLAWAQGRGGMD